jgi:hypothetical protein
MVISNYEQYAKKLTTEEKMLLTLRDELYKGEWENMLKDLNDRLNVRPYIFKLMERIKKDIKRIENLQEYERKHNINIMDYIPQ